MDRVLRGSSAEEAEEYLVSVFSTCSGFELAVVTSAEAQSRQHLRERLAATGAEITVASPSVDSLLAAPRLGSEGHRSLVLWIESEDEERWRELAAALNRTRERVRNEHRYLWVLAGPLSLRRIMTRQAQDIYSGAYKVPHVIEHAGAELRWLHLSDLQLGPKEPGRRPRQGGDVWRSVEELLLPDLARMQDDQGAGPDLVLVSGDLGVTGIRADYEDVDRFLDRLLDELERRGGTRPLLLAVPGNHDVLRPSDPVERWPFEVLRRHDAEDDPVARSLREHLWEHRDARVLEPLFAGYGEWARRRVLEALQPDDVGLEAGVAYVRSVVASHVPGDWSVVLEKDDFRLGIVGLNTAWTSFDDVKAGEVLLPFEQLAAALGSRGPSGWVDGVHECLLVTHHGPEWLSKASKVVLAERIQPLVRFAVQLCGPRHGDDEGGPSEATAALMVQRGYPCFAWGVAQQGRPSGYRLGRIARDGRVASTIRVLEPIPARGAWRYVEGAESGASEPSAREQERESSSWLQEVERYLGKLEALHSYVHFVGFETRVRVALRLDELYVPLDAMIERQLVQHEFGSAAEAETVHAELAARGHEIALADAFEAASRMGRRGLVILGDPGSGKTTHLEQMLLKVARDGPESMGLPLGTVPVFVPLRKLGYRTEGLLELVQQELRSPSLGMTDDFGERLVRRGKLLLLLDGLDELTNAGEQARVAHWLERAQRELPDSYLVVSCRYAGYRSGVRLSASFLELHLRPLDDARVEEFVRRWFSIAETSLLPASERATAERRATERAESLLEALRKPELRAAARVYELTHNPLLLTTICLVHSDTGRLPDRRVGLYDQCVNMLLGRWNDHARDMPMTVPAKQARAVLQPVARWMHDEHGRTRATAAELEPVLREAMDGAGLPMDPRAFLGSIRDESGLLTGWGADEYGFVHLGFQEYLAAREIKSMGFLEKEPFRDLAEKFAESWWQEVILLMLAQDDPPPFEPFMRELVQRPEFPEWAGSAMMERCLQEATQVSARPFVELLRTTASGRDVEELSRRQLAAAQLLARSMPEELEALALGEHPRVAVRTWWLQHPRR